MSDLGSGEVGSGADKLAEISQSAAMIAGIIQAGVFLSLGPFVCVYGPSIFRLVAFLRSLFASNYLHFISAVAAVNEMTAFEVFCDKMIVLLTGTLTLTIASLRNRKIRAYAAGAVMGTMILTPLVELVRAQLYFGLVGCTGVGEKTALFPNGEPVGCDHTSTEFQLTFQGTKFVLVTGVAAFAFAGKTLMDFSIALMGATMMTNGSLDLMKVVLIEIIPQEQANEVITTFATIEPWLVYAIAGGGYVLQKALLHYVPKPENDGFAANEEIQTLKRQLREAQEKAAKEMGAKITFEKVAVLRERSEVKVPLIGCMVTGCLGKTMKLLHKADEALGNYIENMDNKSKGKKPMGKAKMTPLGMVKKAMKKKPKSEPGPVLQTV